MAYSILLVYNFQEVQIGRGYFTQYTQTVNTRDYGTFQTLPSIDASLVCSYPVIIPPKQRYQYHTQVSRTEDATAIYDISVRAYKSSTFQSPYNEDEEVS